MKIYTRIVMDWDGNVIESESYEYCGPVMRCDRSIQQTSAAAAGGAGGTAGGYGSEAESAFGGAITPLLQRARGEAPGVGAMGLADMLNAATTSGAAARGSADEQARLRAARTGNAAALNSTTSAIGAGTARAAGSTIEDALAQNAMLKEQQTTGALGKLGNLYDTGERGEMSALEAQNQFLNTDINAGKSGWLQNLTSTLGTIGGLGADAAGAYKSLYK